MINSDTESLGHWPVADSIYLTLDLEQDYGTAVTETTFEAATRTDVLVDVLERHDVPLTCFVQTQVLDRVPQSVRALEDCAVDVSFHAHTHTHPKRNEADVGTEIARSIDRVRDRFDTKHTGFRFPDGSIRPTDYHLLSDHDVAFDASIFPIWRPGRFNRASISPYPFKHSKTDIVELPFSVVNPTIRVPVSLSYLKLLGRAFEEYVYQSAPEVVVFDMHMHDLVVPSRYESLPSHYQAIYRRRMHEGVTILDRFITRFKSMGYSFRLMWDLYEDTLSAFDSSGIAGPRTAASQSGSLGGEG